MKIHKIFTVYQKELKDTFREKKAVVMMILIPLLLYPLLMIVVSQFKAAQGNSLEKQQSIIALSKTISPHYVEQIKKNKKIEIVQSSDPANDLAEEKISAWIEKTKNHLLIHFNGVQEKSRLARNRLENILFDLKRQVQEENLQELQISTKLLDPFKIKSKNSASKTKMGGMILGFILPLLLIVTMLVGAMYPAIDLVAGEKERGTLETILTTPISKTELLFGKFLTVTTTALITGVLNLSSMMMTYSLGLVQLGKLTGSIEFTISLSSLAVIFLLLIPIAFFISAVIITISLFAKSFKDASSMLSPVMIVLMMPAFVSTMPGIEISTMLSLVPITNISLLCRELFINNFQWEFIALAFLSNTIYAILSISIVSKLYSAENMLFSENARFSFSFKRNSLTKGSVFDSSTAFIIVSVLFLLQIYIGSYAQMFSPVGGLLISEWLLIALPVIALTWFFKRNFKDVFYLNRFNSKSFIATLLIALAGFGFALLIGGIQETLFPEAAKNLEDALLPFVTQLNSYPLLFRFFVLGLTAGVCEELLFRGVFLSSLKGRLPKWTVIIIVAVIFGFYHINLLRLTHTIFLGILLTYIVYRTESIYLSIIAHTIINSLALVTQRIPGFENLFNTISGNIFYIAIFSVAMIALLFSGVRLLGRRKQN